MEKYKDLFTKKFLFVLACFAVIIDLSALIYVIYAHDLRVVIVVMLVALPSAGSIYRGLTGLKK
ncbi:MAG: hypothetical protein ACREV6_09775 [Clostridium sp.]|uniref:hypothetical protein n=1 Tax=Clostridium sp. TaxID=1506 RepID=UPI003D6CC07B